MTQTDGKSKVIFNLGRRVQAFTSDIIWERIKLIKGGSLYLISPATMLPLPLLTIPPDIVSRAGQIKLIKNLNHCTAALNFIVILLHLIVIVL